MFIVKQWFDCTTNEPIKGATDSTFSPTASGNYGVMVFYEDGCTSTGCYAYSIGQEETDLPGDWTFYPNPSAGRIVLDIRSDALPAHAEIMAADGRVLNAFEIENQDQEILLNQSPGVYFIRLTSKGTTTVKKIILH